MILHDFLLFLFFFSQILYSVEDVFDKSDDDEISPESNETPFENGKSIPPSQALKAIHATSRTPSYFPIHFHPHTP